MIQRSDARMVGQAYETPFSAAPAGPIDAHAIAAMVTRFHDTYERRSGNRFEHSAVQGVTFRVQATVAVERASYAHLDARGSGGPMACGEIVLEHLEGGPCAAREYERADLRAGDVIAGPAVVREALSTTFLPAAHRLAGGTYGELIITAEA